MMKIWIVPRLPFVSDCYAINLFGIVVARKSLSAVDVNHERIHTLQQRELLFVGFYVLYLVLWFCLLLKYRSSYKAYRQLPFEREAYEHQGDLNYAYHRQHFAWMRLSKS